MSQENVEVVQRNVEAFRREDLDTYLQDVGQDIELDYSTVRGPYRGVYRGPEGARQFFNAFWEAWESITPLSAEYIDLGDKVVLVARLRFRARGSGVEVGGAGMGAVYTLRGGKIVGYEQFQDKAEALEAAGLSE
jgi:uncharacterized protein